MEGVSLAGFSLGVVMAWRTHLGGLVPQVYRRNGAHTPWGGGLDVGCNEGVQSRGRQTRYAQFVQVYAQLSLILRGAISSNT